MAKFRGENGILIVLFFLFAAWIGNPAKIVNAVLTKNLLYTLSQLL